MKLLFALAFAFLLTGAGLPEPEPAPEAMAKVESDIAKSEATRGKDTDDDTLYWQTPNGGGQYLRGLKDVTCQACQGSVKFSGRLFVGRDVVFIKMPEKPSRCFFSSGVECQGDGVELKSKAVWAIMASPIEGLSPLYGVALKKDEDLSLRFD